MHETPKKTFNEVFFYYAQNVALWLIALKAHDASMKGNKLYAINANI